MANDFIYNVKIDEFEKILMQDRFKNVNHDLKKDIEHISTIFKFSNQNNDSLYSFADGLIRVPYEQIYVSGGYFFKYSQNNPYAIIFPVAHKKFQSNQKIDLYFSGDFENWDIKTIFKPRYTTLNGTDMSLGLNHNGAEITINYLHCNDNTIKTGTSAIFEFDANFCKVAYNIKNKDFAISSWFKSENAELFPRNVDLIRELKFKMKGFYEKQNEVEIWAAAKKTSLEETDSNKNNNKRQCT